MVVWCSTLILILLIAGVFLWVAIQSKKESEYTPVIKKWYKARSVYGILLILLMLIVSIYTLRELPYNKPSHVEGAEVIRVDVEAFQFGFDIEQQEFSVGDTVQ